MTDSTNNAPRVLAVIPARGGSKRLPGKNVLNLGGKPLIDWTVEAALESGVPSKVVVSSDDDEILTVGKRYPSIYALKRPLEFAGDTATTASAVIHALEEEEAKGNHYEIVLLLQPTSPLRSSADIQEAYDLYRTGHCETVVSICEVDHPLEWCGTITEANHFECSLFDRAKRSQDYTASYRLNGAVYVADVNHIKEAQSLFTDQLIGHVMPKERSVDIDSSIDFYVCEKILSMDKH